MMLIPDLVNEVQMFRSELGDNEYFGFVCSMHGFVLDI